MSEKKELNIEELEKVSGGEGLGGFKLSFVKIYYKENGVSKDIVVAFKYETQDRTLEDDENDAQLWCQNNGYEYVSCEKTVLSVNDSVKLWGLSDY